MPLAARSRTRDARFGFRFTCWTRTTACSARPKPSSRERVAILRSTSSRKETGIPQEKLDKVKGSWAETPFSLDRPVGDEDGRKFIDFSPRRKHDVARTRPWSRKSGAEEVRRLLGTLTPIESRIIRWRFGLGRRRRAHPERNRRQVQLVARAHSAAARASARQNPKAHERLTARHSRCTHRVLAPRANRAAQDEVSSWVQLLLRARTHYRAVSRSFSPP